MGNSNYVVRYSGKLTLADGNLLLLVHCLTFSWHQSLTREHISFLSPYLCGIAVVHCCGLFSNLKQAANNSGSIFSFRFVTIYDP